MLGTHDVPHPERERRGEGPSQPAGPSALRQAGVGRHRAQPGLVVGHHQAARPAALELLLPLRPARPFQPLRGRLDGCRPRECRARPEAHRGDLPQARRETLGAHPALRPGRAHDQPGYRPTARPPRREPIPGPTSRQRRQPLLRSPVQDPEVPPRLSRPLPRPGRGDRLLQVLLPLVQHRAPACRHRHADSGDRPLRPGPSRDRTAPASAERRLETPPGTIRRRRADAPTPASGRLDQQAEPRSIGDGSANPRSPCVKLVDRFRSLLAVRRRLSRGIPGRCRSARGCGR